MKREKPLFFCFRAMVLPLIPLWATTATASSSLSLRIDEAVKRALDRNPTVLSDRERVGEADQAYLLAISKLFPNITGLASAFKEKAAVNGVSVPFGGESYNQYTAQLKLVQPIYEGGALWQAVDSARKDRELRQKDLEIAERDLTAQVIAAFYSVLLNQQELEIYRYTLAQEKQTEALVERFHKIGRAQFLDLLQIKTQVALLYPKISTAENQMKASASQLMSLLHDSQSEAIELQGQMKYLEPSEVMKLLSKRKPLPELQQSQVALDQFQSKADIVLAQYYPSFEFQALFGKTANSQSDLLNDFSNTWSVGFQLTVPIFTGFGMVRERRVLASQEQQLVYNQQKLLDTLSYNQVQAERSLEVAAAVLKSSKEAADYADASLKEAHSGFKMGTITYLQVNTSEQNFVDAQTRFIEARYGYIDALSKYFVSAGIPISELVRILADG